MQEVPEFHQQGHLSIENLEFVLRDGLGNCDVGLQVADDGRIWLCVNSVAFLRFKPLSEPGEASNAVWQVFQQGDMTEGRGGMVVRGDKVYRTEQEAWDSINERGGVMGRKPPTCWPADQLRRNNVTTWQGYKKVVGHAGDYDVRPLRFSDS